jgi:D-3-phosphoglycerate dehydrogenase / 2-oxoglutarate reductase
MYKILVSDKLSQEGIDVFRQDADFQVDVKLGMKPHELKSVIGDYDALVVRSDTQVTADIISSATKLKVVGRAGVGLDNIDIPAATRAGVIVMNTPDGNTISAAEHTMAMILSLARNIPQANASMKAGKWERSKFMGVELHGKTLGIIGLGRIGSEVAKRARSFGMKLVAYDPFASPEKANSLGAEIVSLDELLKTSDFITPHAPKTKDTAHLIGAKELAMMKKGVRLVNVARGGIYDEAALADAVASGHIAGIALDVFEVEPPKDSPLLGFDNVITTPHLGASTEEAQVNVAIALAYQIIDALKGGTIANAANIPAIDIAEWRELKPYYDLCETLAKFSSELLSSSRFKKIHVGYSGDVTTKKTQALTLVILKSLLEQATPERVNFVNAHVVAKERDVEIAESKTTDSVEYTNLITLTLASEETTITLSGMLTAQGESRIVDINGFRVDIAPVGNLIIFFNRDVPGILGKVSTILGNDGVNIAGLANGRKAPGEEAVTIISVDNEVPPNSLQAISGIEGLHDVRVVSL